MYTLEKRRIIDLEELERTKISKHAQKQQQSQIGQTNMQHIKISNYNKHPSIYPIKLSTKLHAHLEINQIIGIN